MQACLNLGAYSIDSVLAGKTVEKQEYVAVVDVASTSHIAPLSNNVTKSNSLFFYTVPSHSLYMQKLQGGLKIL